MPGQFHLTGHEQRLAVEIGGKWRLGRFDGGQFLFHQCRGSGILDLVGQRGDQLAPLAGGAQLFLHCLDVFSVLQGLDDLGTGGLGPDPIVITQH